jgi:hypothetical protein
MAISNSMHDVAAGFTLVIEFADEGTRQTLMIPIDREGHAISGSVSRLDDLPLGQTRVDEELIVNGRRQRVVAIAKTLRMRLTFDDE